MAGLISNVMDTKPTANMTVNGGVSMAGATGIDPETRMVDAENETVSGQLDKVLKNGSPLLERAKAGAVQSANKRGLVNSSMAAGAGQAAMIDAALPIATADAGVYGAAAKDNQAVKNAALAVGADAANKASLANAGAANEFSLQQLKGQQATQLADIEAQYKNLVQTSSSAAQMLTQAQKNITDILNSADTSAEQKQSAVDKQVQLLRSNLAIVGSIGDMNLASLLTFNG